MNETTEDQQVMSGRGIVIARLDDSLGTESLYEAQLRAIRSVDRKLVV